jgi:hypothetical protein
MIKKLEKILQDYAKAANKAQDKYKTDLKYAKENYAGQLYASREQELRNHRNSEISALKTQAQKHADEAIRALRENVDKLATTANPESLSELNLMRNMKLTPGELQALSGKYRNDYMCMKLLADIADASGLKLGYKTLDDMKTIIDTMETDSIDFLMRYAGTEGDQSSYVNMLITNREHPFSQYEEAFSKVDTIDVTYKPDDTLSAEQKKTIKSLFVGYEDNPKLRAAELTVLGMQGEKLLSDFYIVTAEEAGEE